MATVIVKDKKPYHMGRWTEIVFVAAAAYTSLTDGVGDIFFVGDYDNLVLILDITASATDAADVLDVKLDGSWDNVTYYNLGEFTQRAGNAGAPAAEMMQFRKGGIVADEDALLVLTADAGATVIRPSMCPPYLRVTTTIARVTGTDESHTFSVKGYVQ